MKTQAFMLSALLSSILTTLVMVGIACGDDDSTTSAPQDALIEGVYEVVVPDNAPADLIPGMRLSRDTENNVFRLSYTKSGVAYVERWDVTDRQRRY